MNPFVYNANPGRVIFGPGSHSQIASEVQLMNAGKALVLATPTQSKAAHRLSDQLGSFLPAYLIRL
ncbi:hypothetical protein [Aliamphritea spongicola]|nr:hypothetical protein [Aliamphritea spongicola]